MKPSKLLLLTCLISAAMHSAYFSRELTGFHVWRQTQTQSTIVNFYEEDMNILNPRRNDRGNGDGIFRMEFPLMQWLVACLYTLFGNHLIITRLFVFVVGLFSTLGMYRLVLHLFSNTKAATIAAWTFTFSPCFFYYTVNPLPDLLALCFAIWGITFFFGWITKQQRLYLVGSGLLLALGALCKLPFILFYMVPFVYFLLHFKSTNKTQWFIDTLLLFSCIVFPAAWYVWVIPGWQHTGIDDGMLDNQSSWWQIFDYLQGNLISTLPELLLNYGSVPFFVAGFYFLVRNKAYRHPYFKLLLGLSAVVLAYFLFEINMIGIMHDYYLFPFLPLLFILVAYGAVQLLNSQQKTLMYTTYALLLLLPLTAYLRGLTRWDKDSVGFNKDLLTYKEELRKAVPKDALCITGNDESHFINFYFIDQKGWAFENDNLSNALLEQYVRKGAQYLYTDSKQEMAAEHLDTLVLTCGTVSVYRLK